MTARRTYRFDGFLLDPAARELRHDGERVPLPVSALDCLAYLVEHRDRAVGRDELMAAVWGRAGVGDTLLSQAVLRLRHVLGDTRSGQRMIRTVPRFGYHWVAQVEVDEGDATPSLRSAPAEKRSASTRGRRLRGWLAALVLIGVAAAIVGLWPWQPRSVPVPPRAVELAVLPVRTQAGAEWSWIRLGLMDAIGEHLRKAGVTVVPSSNVVALADADHTDLLSAVREATGARRIAVPDAALSEGRWNVHLELHGADGTRRSVDARDADVLVAGRRAGDRLLALLGRSQPLDPAGQASLDELRQRVRAALLVDDIDGARRLLDAADPAIAAAPELGLQRAAIEFSSGDAEAAGRRLRAMLAALPDEAEPELRARVHNSLGAVAIRLDRYAEAESAFARAIALLEARDAPATLGRAHLGRASAGAALGRHEAALADFARARIALELAGDALELARVEENEGVLDSQRGRHEDALRLFASAERRFERFGALSSQVKTISNAIAAHLALLDSGAALAASDRGWPLLGRVEDTVVRHVHEYERARALAAAGRSTEAQALFGRLARESDPRQEATLLAQARVELARSWLTAGRADDAASLAGAAAEALDAGANYTRDRGRAWLVAARALRAAGRLAEAEALVEGMSPWAAAQVDSPAPVYAWLARAEQQRASEDRDAAGRSYRTALRYAEERGVPLDLVAVVSSYGGSLLDDGDPDRASAVIGQVARFAGRDFDCALLQVRLHAALGRSDAWRNAREVARRLAGERIVP